MRRYWTISLQGSDETKLRSVLFDTLQKSSDHVKDQLISGFHTFVAERELADKWELREIERSRKLSLREYELAVKSRIASLQEDISLARVLGIKKNTLESQSFGENVVAINQEQTPRFMQGYEALEKELSIIQSRQDKTLFIPKLRELEIRKLAIETSEVLERQKQQFNKTPLIAGGFQAAQFDFFSIDITPGSNRLIMIAVLGIIFSMAAVGYVLISKILE